MYIKYFIAVICSILITSVYAQERAYVVDARGAVVTSGTGLCWRTGSWTPAIAAADPAVCGCDADVVPASVCTTTPTRVAGVKPVTSKMTIAADALFDFDKAVLRSEGKAKLDELVAKAGAIKIEVILVVGHTDRIGSASYNQKLSERRAAAVKSYLVSKGIEANRVATSGLGKLQPVTTDCRNITINRELIACLQPDRRVEVQVIGTK